MPIWSDILKELIESRTVNEPPKFDDIHRKYLAALAEYAQRDTIWYASKWFRSADNISANNQVFTLNLPG